MRQEIEAANQPGGKKKKKKNNKKKKAAEGESGAAATEGEAVPQPSETQKTELNSEAAKDEKNDELMDETSTKVSEGKTTGGNEGLAKGEDGVEGPFESREPTGEEIKEALSYQRVKQDEALRIRKYQQQVMETDADNFRDRPDPIN